MSKRRSHPNIVTIVLDEESQQGRALMAFLSTLQRRTPPKLRQAALSTESRDRVRETAALLRALFHYIQRGGPSAAYGHGLQVDDTLSKILEVRTYASGETIPPKSRPASA
ncbi:MAG: hypothetical protein KDB53_01650 [Planctomycetes bacterium]|nr:hypothetical protein [Planctomycetota bacterium]